MDWTQAVPLAGCVAAGAAYGRGLGRGRGTASWRTRAVAFYGGLGAILVALVWPLDGLADRSFAMHMAQHVLLLSVAPPLLVLGRPWLRVWRPLPLRLRRPAARGAVRLAAAAPPALAWLLLNGLLVGWHVPVLYDAAIRHDGVHILEHLSFLGSGLLFWAFALGAPPLHTRLPPVWRLVYLTLAMLPGWILALVLAFDAGPIYPAYAELATRPWGLSAAADQQLAAGIMWVPGGIPYLIAIVVLFYRWLEPAGATPSRLAARPS